MSTNSNNRLAALLAPPEPLLPLPILLRESKPEHNCLALVRRMFELAEYPTEVATLPEVAKHFGVRAGTVRVNWRADDMPGENGRYDLPLIACWLIAKDAANEGREIFNLW